MKRTTAILIGGVALVAIGATVVAVQSYQVRQGNSYFTNGHGVRIALEGAQPRTVVWETPVALDAVINTAADEYEPRMSADGQIMLIVRGKAGENADILISRRVGWPPEQWGPPEPPEELADINTEDDELGPELSRDGQVLYFHSNRPGGVGGYDLWRSQRSESGWTEPENLGPAVNSPHNEYGACLSPDGRKLLFASNRPRADEPAEAKGEAWSATLRENLPRHDFDLFVSIVENDKPGDAQRLDALNTEANEGSPAFSPEGDFLWFCSDRPGGSGGFDLHRSRIVRGEFQQPENVGPEVNSPFNELDPALAMGGFELFFSSDRQDALGAAETLRYDVFRTMSRDVFTELDDSPWIDWAGLWYQILPALMWLLLSLVALLLLLLLINGVRSRRLSLLMRCLLASLMVHVIVMMLLTLWEVTTSIAGIIRAGSGTKVVLSSHGQSGDLVLQIRGGSTDAVMAMPDVSESQRQDASVPQATVQVEPVMLEAHSIELAANEVMPMHDSLESAPEMREHSLAVQPPPIEASASLNLAAPPDVLPAQQAEQGLVMSVQTEFEPTQRDSASDAIPTSIVDQPPDVVINSAAISVPAGPMPLMTSSASESGIEATPAPPQQLAMNVAVGVLEVDAAGFETPRDAAVAAAEAQAASPVTTNESPSSRMAESRPMGIASIVQPTIETERQPVGVPTQRLVDASEIGGVSDSTPEVTDQPASNDASMNIEPTAVAIVTMMEGAPTGGDRVAMEAESQIVSPTEMAGSTQVRIDSATRALPSDSPTLQETAAAQIEIASNPIGGSPVEIADARVTDDPSSDNRASIDPTMLASGKSVDFNLGLPTEIAPPVNPYVQRAEDVRQDLVERLGGSDATENAVNLALKWLAAHQSDDGRWASADFDEDCGECGGKGRFETDIATTGLALLCFLGADHTHVKDGIYKDHVTKALDWLLTQIKSDGDLRGRETMYSQGIATIALSEAWGMTHDARLEEPVRKAIGFIAAARNRTTDAGGWRYEPGQMGDTSVLGWQVMAMISARRSGIAVEDDALKAAANWIDHVSLAQRPGRYAYQPGQRFTPSMTAEGLFVLQLLGVSRDEPRMNRSVEYVLEHPPHWDEQPNTYYWYYATLALFQHQGEAWQRWNETLTRELLANQRTSGPAAGSWDPHDNWSRIGGRVYQTALCTLCLEVYYRYLPMYAATPSPKP